MHGTQPHAPHPCRVEGEADSRLSGFAGVHAQHDLGAGECGALSGGRLGNQRDRAGREHDAVRVSCTGDDQLRVVQPVSRPVADDPERESASCRFLTGPADD
ncbi:hypothetical protein [Streptomyces sp. Root369]|uniref:hypothetical protein n=1 Tax=Streptomyces sp. Root369 TaxID=1736523 RepID=UPI00070B7E83|nr:hypothetical protein [Streptomyces sp. Root369]KQW02371.1 hypothetical protein ASD08_45275 [Streptomyces sp. Root369]